MRRRDYQTLVTADGRLEIWGTSKRGYLVWDNKREGVVCVRGRAHWSAQWEARAAMLSYLNGKGECLNKQYFEARRAAPPRKDT